MKESSAEPHSLPGGILRPQRADLIPLPPAGQTASWRCSPEATLRAPERPRPYGYGNARPRQETTPDVEWRDDGSSATEPSQLARGKDWAAKTCAMRPRLEYATAGLVAEPPVREAAQRPCPADEGVLFEEVQLLEAKACQASGVGNFPPLQAQERVPGPEES